jgi:hypothetical protein
MNWKTWLKGLAAAVIGGTTTTTFGYIGQYAQTAATTGTTPAMSGKVVGSLALGGGLLGVIGYLMKSPLTPVAPVPKTEK